MRQGDRSKRLRPSNNLLSRVLTITRLGLLAGIIVVVLFASVIFAALLSRRNDPTAIAFNLSPSADMNAFESIYLGAYLAANDMELYQPAKLGAPISIEIAPGETVDTIASELVSLGAINNPSLFRNYVRYYGLDRHLEAGTHHISPNTNIPEIAVALTSASAPEITARIPEGWRREQIAEWIDQQTNFPFRGSDFLEATGSGSSLVDEAGLATDLPSTATLEGFLFPDTYRLNIDSPATDLAKKALVNFDQQVDAQMRLDIASNGLTLFQVVTLASIVEREAVVDEERPIIASVYLNRLSAGMNLEADPTVQYSMGYQSDSGLWWKLSLTQDDYGAIVSPYNTYLNAGLPPGPIANPSLASITAVIYPAQTQYLFFRATCDGSGRHRFAMTYEDHVNNACP